MNSTEKRNWNSSRTKLALQKITDSEEKGGLKEFEGHKVLIRTEELDNPNCQYTFFLLINLLARLPLIFEQIDISAQGIEEIKVSQPSVKASNGIKAVKELGAKLESPVDISIVENPKSSYDVILNLGNLAYEPRTHVVNVSSNGWLVRISTSKSVSSFGNNLNPIGAYTAACMGLAETFKYILLKENRSIKRNIELIDQTLFSTLDYSVDDESPPNPKLPDSVDIGVLHVIGVGAGGGALLYALKALETLRGKITLVDHEKISSSNLNRYIWAFSRDKGNDKTEVAKDFLKDSHKALQVETYPKKYQKFISETDDESLEKVVSTVDKTSVRRKIQWDLPYRIFDAATNARGEYVVCLVKFGDTECMGSRRLNSRDKNHGTQLQTNALAEKLGLKPDKLENMYENNQKFTAKQISSILNHIESDYNFKIPEVGQKFRVWRKNQCGEMELKEVPGPVPAPFLPINAGLLLAGELIKYQHFPEFSIDKKITHNMLSIPQNIMLRKTSPQSDCPICGDNQVVKRYFKKWRNKD